MAVRSLRAKIVIIGNSKWVKNHHFCAQLSHCFSHHQWLCGLGKYPPQATSTSVNNWYILIIRFKLLELLLSKQHKRITLISLTWNWLKISELVPELNVTFTQLYEYIVGPIRMSLQLNDNFSFTSSPSNWPFTSKVASEHAHCPLDSLVRKVKLKN